MGTVPKNPGGKWGRITIVVSRVINARSHLPVRGWRPRCRGWRSSLSDVSVREARLEFPRPLDGSSRRRGPAEDDVSLPEQVVRTGRQEAEAWLRASLTHSAPAGVAYALSKRSRKRRISSTR